MTLKRGICTLSLLAPWLDHLVLLETLQGLFVQVHYLEYIPIEALHGTWEVDDRCLLRSPNESIVMEGRMKENLNSKQEWDDMKPALY